MNELRTMHLFAGIGGGLLADLILGHRPVAAVEWDAYACRVLRERAAEGWFPDLRVWEGDVRMFDPSEYTGQVDCIHAGFPCQPFSVAGLRKGSQDERGELFAEVVRCVEAIRPKYVFLENVPGLTTSKSPSCICGWPYRRGGLFKNPSPDEANDFDIYASCANEHVEQSADARGANATGIRGEHLRSQITEREMVGSMAMAYQRGRSKQLREANSPIFNAEAEASGFDFVASSVEGVAANSKERNKGMDSGSKGQGIGYEGDDAPHEQEGAGCPNCGRRLVSTESGFIWYMESVLWTLASMGYDSRWICLRASDVGAPHHRDRWFCRAVRNTKHPRWYAAEITGGFTQRGDHNQIGQEQTIELTGSSNSTALADSCCAGLQRSETSRNDEVDRKKSKYEQPSRFSRGAEWFETESRLDRVANGIPYRVQRLKGLGNAQVPIQAAVAWKLLGGE